MMRVLGTKCMSLECFGNCFLLFSSILFRDRICIKRKYKCFFAIDIYIHVFDERKFTFFFLHTIFWCFWNKKDKHSLRQPHFSLAVEKKNISVLNVGLKRTTLLAMWQSKKEGFLLFGGCVGGGVCSANYVLLNSNGQRSTRVA